MGEVEGGGLGETEVLEVRGRGGGGGLEQVGDALLRCEGWRCGLGRQRGRGEFFSVGSVGGVGGVGSAAPFPSCKRGWRCEFV